MKFGFFGKAAASLFILALWSGSGHAGSSADVPEAARGANAAPAKNPQDKEATYRDGELIVKFREKTTEAAKNKLHLAKGAKKLKDLPGLRMHHVKLREGLSVEEAIRQYQSDPNVEYAEPNYIYTADALPNDLRFAELWAMRNTGQTGGTPNADINATAAWDITTGSSDVVVAIIDSGIDYTHPDLAANVWNNPWEKAGDGVDDDGNGYVDDIHGIDTANGDSDPMDDYGHGTHVAGTIGAVGANGEGVVGVNWNVKLMACKFLGASGKGDVANAATCMQYIKGMKDRGVNIAATSNSWGGAYYSQAMYDAIAAMPDVLFIAAAGNDGQENSRYPHYPASYDLPNIISVAATDESDQLAYFSDYGKLSVHLGAPGVGILSTVPAQNVWGMTGGYGLLKGTSMATPHVTGVAALLKAQDGGRDWKTIKNLLLAGGDSVPSLQDKTVTGKRLNAFGSLACVNRPVFASRTIPGTLTPGVPVPISVLSINCGTPSGPVRATTSGGETVTFADDGMGADQAAGDGVFTAMWTPSGDGERIDISSPAGSVSLIVPQLRVYLHQPEANVHAAYRQSLSGTGGVKPYTWTVLSGTLPPGLALESAAGVISGTPTTAGTYTFTVQVTDSTGGTATGSISLKVADDYLLETTAQSYDSGDQDQNFRVSFDSDGNYFVAGRSYVPAKRGYDAVVSKYDPAGAVVWTRSYGGTSDVYNADVKPDAAGNVYLAGRAKNAVTGIGDWFLAKYDASGNLTWSRSYDGGWEDYLGGIAVDATGNLYVSGLSSILHKDTRVWENRIATVKFDQSGNVVWQRLSPHSDAFTNGHDYGSGIAIDGAGNLYVGGGTAYTDPVTGTYCASNLVAIKYDPSGNELWANTSGKVNYGSCSAYYPGGTSGGVAVDAGGNVYMTGVPTYGVADGCMTAKYDATGKLLWQTPYDGPTSSDYSRCNGIAIDGAGNSYVAVTKESLGVAPYTYSFSIVKYAADGHLIWEKVMNAGPVLNTSSAYGGAMGVTLDAKGDIHATGLYNNGVNFDALTVTIEDLLAAPHINPVQLADGMRGVVYRGTFQVSGGSAPYVWSIASGTLPGGLTLDTATGVISGTPTATGTFSFTVRVTDAKSATATATATLVISGVSISTTSLAQAVLGYDYSQTVTATGGVAPYSWSTSGVLPTGLHCGASTGQISGMPVTSGLYLFTVQVTDAQQSKASQPLSIYVPASACLNAPVRLNGHATATYSSFAAAYAQASDGDAIQLQNIAYGGDILFDRSIKTTLQGGYDCGFGSNAFDSRLLGKLRLTSGTAKVDKLRFR